VEYQANSLAHRPRQPGAYLHAPARPGRPHQNHSLASLPWPPCTHTW
jgi:hypothetical protein